MHIQTYSAPPIMKLSDFLCKTKYFQTWNQKCLICVILGLKSEIKIIAIFEISIYELVKMQSYAQSQKYLDLGQKNAFFSIFLD